MAKELGIENWHQRKHESSFTSSRKNAERQRHPFLRGSLEVLRKASVFSLPEFQLSPCPEDIYVRRPKSGASTADRKTSSPAKFGAPKVR